MARASRRNTRLLHMELLENRCLLTGSASGLTPAPVLTLVPALAAVVVVQAPPPLPQETPPPAAATSDPAADVAPVENAGPSTTGDGSATAPDTSSDNGAVSSGSADGQSLTADSSGTLQGDLGNATTGAAGEGADQTSSDTGAGTDLGDAASGEAAQDPIQPIQDATISTGSITPIQPASGLTVIPLTTQDTPITSVAIISLNGNHQQGDGSGTTGGDSGTGDNGNGSGSDATDQNGGTDGAGNQSGAGANGQDFSATSTGQSDTATGVVQSRSAVVAELSPANPGEGNSPTTPASTANPHPATPATSAPSQPRVDGPHPAEGANPGSSSPADPGNSQSSNSPAVGSQSPKLSDISTPHAPPALVQVENVKTAQRILTDLESPTNRTESARLVNAGEVAESAGEKRSEGAKGDFSIGERPPQAAEPEEAGAHGENILPDSRELAVEAAVDQVLIQALTLPGPGLLASAASVNLPALEKGVQDFFGQLNQLGQQIAAVEERTGVPHWLVALACAGVALEVARRRLKPAGGDRGAPDPSWAWFAGTTDPLALDPG